MSDGPTISGGGAIRVETPGMMRAAQQLDAVHAALLGLSSAVEACAASCPPGGRRLHLHEALVLIDRALEETERVADGLRTAAFRYGVVEQAALEAQRTIWATIGSAIGTEARLLAGALGLPGMVIVGSALVGSAVGALALRTALRDAVDGEVQPQLDPAVLEALGLSLTSLDDVIRGFLLIERPQDLVTDDPAAPFGSQTIAAVLAAALLTPAGGPLAVTAGRERRVTRPGSLTALAGRIPDGAEPAGQIRIERYDGAEGRHWIVYIAGTVTFEPDSGDEPFDLASDLRGVADQPTDAGRAVLQAMDDAGVGRDEPVLLVGHSQGALTAVRIAQHGGYDVGGVVQFGGPTGQIALPPDIPVLSVEHDEDLVPELGGVAATGAPGLRRLVVSRSLPLGGAAPGAAPLSAGVPAHGLVPYTETLRRAEASGDQTMTEFRNRLGGFLDGDDGTAQRYRARRVILDPTPTAVARPAR